MFPSLCKKHAQLKIGHVSGEIICTKCGALIGMVWWGEEAPNIHIFSRCSRWHKEIKREIASQIQATYPPKWVTLNREERSLTIEPWSPNDVFFEPIEDFEDDEFEDIKIEVEEEYLVEVV